MVAGALFAGTAGAIRGADEVATATAVSGAAGVEGAAGVFATGTCSPGPNTFAQRPLMPELMPAPKSGRDTFGAPLPKKGESICGSAAPSGTPPKTPLAPSDTLPSKSTPTSAASAPIRTW